MSEEILDESQVADEISPELQEKKGMMAQGFLMFFGAAILILVVPTFVMLPVLQGQPVGQAQLDRIFIISLALRFSGLVLLALGCGKYAKAKGYSPWIGLLGLIGIGFIVVLALYDRNQLPGEDDSQF